jgi:hypothetical protein
MTLSASTSGHIEPGQIIGESTVEFSLLGQYDAAVKFANSLKLSKRFSGIPVVVLSGKSVNGSSWNALLATHLSIAMYL